MYLTLKTFCCKSLAGGELFQKMQKIKLQPRILAGVCCLFLTPFQKLSGGDVSSLPLSVNLVHMCQTI